MTGQDFYALSSAIEEIKGWIAPYNIELEINKDVEIQPSDKEESYVYINYSDTSSFELLSETEFWKQMYFVSNS